MNSLESLAQPYSQELPWLAFLYVSEELTPDEAADFEERLLVDQSAREAVANAMKMAEGLWMATAMDSLHSPPPGFVPQSAAVSARKANGVPLDFMGWQHGDCRRFGVLRGLVVCPSGGFDRFAFVHCRAQRSCRCPRSSTCRSSCD